MSTLWPFFAIASTLLATNSVALASDPAAGQTLFKVCAPCHDIGEKARHRAGPMLNGLNGRQAGTIPGYPYSPATRNSGIIWGKAVFKEYLKAPTAMIPGSKMRFTGLLDEEGLNDIWSFVSQYEPDGTIKPRKIPVEPALEDK